MDKRAKDILFKTYWENGCWTDFQHRNVSAEDFLYAKNLGLMFEPLTISHDECVIRISQLPQVISKETVVKAFLSSLSSRRLQLRSAIASWACANRIVPHKYEPVVSGYAYENGIVTYTNYTCHICQAWNDYRGGRKQYQDEDLSVLNFERIKWGGVRFGDLIYTLFDLEQFQKEDFSEPTDVDIAIFKQILLIIDNCDIGTFPGTLRDHLLSQIVSLKSNKAERSVLIEILACIGVLRPLSYDRPTAGRHDWHFAEYWRGEDKYDSIIVQDFFGKYL